MMKPKVDLVSMLLVNVDGRASVPVITERKAKEIFTSVVPVEHAPMLKSA